MNIGEVSRLTGVSTKAIRYYEQIGVLPEPDRLVNGYRTYEDQAVDRLRFVKDAQLTGLSLAEITAILDQRGRGESTCHHVVELLDRHLLELDGRIKTLRKTRSALVTLVERARDLDPAQCVDPNRCQTLAPLTDLPESRQLLASGLQPAQRHTHMSGQLTPTRAGS